MKKDELISCIHQSVVDANNKFAEWSGDYWITAYGVESFLVSEMANAIMRNNHNEKLILEFPVSELTLDGEKRPLGRSPHSLTGRKRIDIMLFNGKYQNTHAIEVKRWWDKGTCYKDLKELCDLLLKYGKKNNGSLEYCIFVLLVYAHGNDSKCLDSKFKELEEKCEQFFIDNFPIDKFPNVTREYKYGKNLFAPCEYDNSEDDEDSNEKEYLSSLSVAISLKKN